MKMRAFCLISLTFATISGFAASRAFFDDFESYAVGSNLHGQGGWTGWANNPNAGAVVSTNFAFSPTRSVNITGASDLVHTFSDATNGPWVFSVMQYIPSTSTGTTAVILMNKYQPPYGTNDLNWSVQIRNNMDTGQIISDLGGGSSLPMIKDQWVEIRCEIDLTANSVSEFYNGQLLSTHAWQGGLGGPGLNEIQALDLFANNAAPVYYDNVSLDAFGPIIKAGPASVTANAGQSVSFAVDVNSGSGTPLYQWERNCAASFQPISGATNATYTITNVTTNDACLYHSVVHLFSYTATSQAAQLTLLASNTLPVITQQPQSVSATQGQTASFSLTATGAANLVYQWRHGTTNLTNDGNISGATTASLTLANVQFADAGDYAA